MKTKDIDLKMFKMISIIFVLIIILIVINLISHEKITKEMNLATRISNKENLDSENIQVLEENKDEENEISKKNSVEETDVSQTDNEFLTTYRGYSVIAKLEIPKIDLETYVLSEYSEQALGVSVTKFFGKGPNDVGNFCIAGHNYITRNMFHNLKKLSVGDTFSLIDINSNKVNYKIYLIETVEPDETQCLSQETDGKIEVTLITCTSDSLKRIIVKAVKI